MANEELEGLDLLTENTDNPKAYLKKKLSITVSDQSGSSISLTVNGLKDNASPSAQAMENVFNSLRNQYAQFHNYALDDVIYVDGADEEDD